MKPVTLNLVSYSGGKDSGALVLHLMEQGVPNLVLVFCDTHWEHPATYRYAYEFAQAVGLRLRVVDSEGMVNLCLRKKRAPSTRVRFCTQELKLKPFERYVKTLHEQGFDTVVWIGVRAEESPARAKMPESEHSDYYDCEVRRPILGYTIDDVKAIHARHGLELNPLYKLGMGRVGCMPCIMANKDELKSIADRFPEVFDKVADLEDKLGRTFWTAGDTPTRFCSKVAVTKDGRHVPVPTARDVRTWATTERGQAPGQVPMFEPPVPACSSKYNLCE
jgi:3'-phosphoadenosine 5'-phosphosulfate sulfotransferase (PAPS reductase)/FAD synthetase